MVAVRAVKIQFWEVLLNPDLQAALPCQRGNTFTAKLVGQVDQTLISRGRYFLGREESIKVTCYN